MHALREISEISREAFLDEIENFDRFKEATALFS